MKYLKLRIQEAQEDWINGCFTEDNRDALARGKVQGIAEVMAIDFETINSYLEQETAKWQS